MILSHQGLVRNQTGFSQTGFFSEDPREKGHLFSVDHLVAPTPASLWHRGGGGDPTLRGFVVQLVREAKVSWEHRGGSKWTPKGLGRGHREEDFPEESTQRRLFGERL